MMRTNTSLRPVVTVLWMMELGGCCGVQLDPGAAESLPISSGRIRASWGTPARPPANLKGGLNMRVEHQIHELYVQIRELFPDAVRVDIVVDSSGITVTPRYMTDLKGFSMQNIRGEWIKKQNIPEGL